jgi:hypothetical protein
MNATHLAHEYGPPDDHFLLARQGGTWVGYGSVRPVADTVCEMKRLFVVPALQGRGVVE